MKKLRSDNSYKGFETLVNSTRMSVKMYGYSFLFFVIVHLFLFAFLSIHYFKSKALSFLFFKTYRQGQLMSLLKPSHILNLSYLGKPYPVEASVDVRQYKAQYYRMVNDLLFRFCGRSVIYLFYPFVIVFFRKRAEGQARPDFIRGAQLITSDELRRQMKGQKTYLKLGGIGLSVESEIRHTFWQ